MPAVVDEVTVVSDRVRLAGSLWSVPNPHAVVVMQPGSGPSDRHNDVLFPPIRDLLLDRDLAVAAFDKRGVGGSAGDWRDAGILEQAADVAAVVDELRDRMPAIPLGLFGHSQGGWVVVESAARCGADFVITNSMPAVTPNRQERFATTLLLKRAGWSAERAAAGMELFDEMLRMCSTGVPFSRFNEWSAPRAARLAELTEVGALIPDDPGRWRLVGRMGDHDPAARLATLDVPILALFGAEDTVVPVDLSVEILRREVDPRLLTIEVLPGAGHRPMDSAGTFVPGYLAAIADFVDRRALREPSTRRQGAVNDRLGRGAWSSGCDR